MKTADPATENQSRTVSGRAVDYEDVLPLLWKVRDLADHLGQKPSTGLVNKIGAVGGAPGGDQPKKHD